MALLLQGGPESWATLSGDFWDDIIIGCEKLLLFLHHYVSTNTNMIVREYDVIKGEVHHSVGDSNSLDNSVFRNTSVFE